MLQAHRGLGPVAAPPGGGYRPVHGPSSGGSLAVGAGLGATTATSEPWGATQTDLCPYRPADLT